MANITLRIDDELLREARVLAATKGTSVSRLVREQIEKLVRMDRRYDAARRRALRRIEASEDLGWASPAAREELHER